MCSQPSGSYSGPLPGRLSVQSLALLSIAMQVDRVIAQQVPKKGRSDGSEEVQYLVKWKDQDYDKASWENESVSNNRSFIIACIRTHMG